MDDFLKKNSTQRTITVPDLPRLSISSSQRNHNFKKVIEEVANLCYPYMRKATKTKKLLDFTESVFLFNLEEYTST